MQRKHTDPPSAKEAKVMQLTGKIHGISILAADGILQVDLFQKGPTATGQLCDWLRQLQGNTSAECQEPKGCYSTSTTPPQNVS